jgi:hypothetical protein
MATANEIATKALKRLGLVNSGESPAAADVSDAVDALSSMIAAWDTRGFVGETLPLATRFEHGVVAMLAVRLAESYGKTPGPILLRDAADGEESLLAAFMPVRQAKVDNALISMSGGASAGYAMRRLNRSTAPTEWAGGYDYSLGDRVYNGAGIYLCVTAGTSASSGGPTGTSSAVVDGSVTWQWERVYGG